LRAEVEKSREEHEQVSREREGEGGRERGGAFPFNPLPPRVSSHFFKTPNSYDPLPQPPPPLTSKKSKWQTRRHESALSEDSAFLHGQITALLRERGAALDRVASLER
jgi:hypothetical protein